ncbi:phage antirepressor KilAC domain-containing protein [Fibrella sp. ES10-3-2-2]|nr:hypothetical protein A6C57_07000 [Fibrella sp. ES10-3-2-2]
MNIDVLSQDPPGQATEKPASTMSIQITTDAQGESVVSARELHDFLQVKSDVHKWFSRRVEKYGFMEGQDFLRVTQKWDTLGGSQEVVDYALTLDCAKELAMVQNNEKGRAARQYFIDCEKQLKKMTQPRIESQPTTQLTRKELALLVIQSEEEKERLEQQLAIAQPKVDYVDQVLDTAECVVTTVIASELGHSAVKFNRLLKERGIQWKVNGVWVLTQKYLGRGYAQMRTHVHVDTKGERHTTMLMVWTQRGRAMLHYLFRQQSNQQSLPGGNVQPL